jgi:hypothetical protein
MTQTVLRIWGGGTEEGRNGGGEQMEVTGMNTGAIWEEDKVWKG